MPMNLLQQFGYFLMVAAIYSLPLILIVFFLSWRKKSVGKGLLLIFAGLIIGAGVLQSSFHLSLLQESSSYEDESQFLTGYSGDVAQPIALTGAYVGTERIGELDYSVYQFRALDRTARWLEVVVPPPGITAAGFLRHNSERLSEQLEARLVVWSDAIRLNPSLAPQEFFENYLPGEQLYDFDVHTLLVNFRARRSTVIYPARVNEEPWLWRDAVNDLN